MQSYNPGQALMNARREFGEHGGVALPVCRSATFTAMDPYCLPELFTGRKGPEINGRYLHGRHFNPTNRGPARYPASRKGTDFTDILQNDEKFGFIDVSAGFYDALMSCSGLSVSSETSTRYQSKMGITPGLVSISVGSTGAVQDRFQRMEPSVLSAGLTWSEI